jgi:diacylglycerol kinase (ATP)
MQKVLIFLNSRAGQSQRLDWERSIRQALFRSELSFVTLDDPESWQSAIQSALEKPADVVITVGGDGTFHSLIQALVDTPSRFLVLPGGTANDLARELGHAESVLRALECVRRDECKTIDLISVNDGLMATNGGIGLVGDVALSVNRYRRQLPGFSRLMSGLKHQVYSAVLGIHLLADRRKTFTIKIDSPTFSGVVETPLLLVNNQPMIAGSFAIAPYTRNDDGRFNITIFLHRDWLDFILAIYRVRRDVPPENDPHIISFETTEATIELLGQERENLAFYGDGEAIASDRILSLKTRPQSLRVYAQSLPSFSHGFESEKGEVG